MYSSRSVHFRCVLNGRSRFRAPNFTNKPKVSRDFSYFRFCPMFSRFFSLEGLLIKFGSPKSTSAFQNTPEMNRSHTGIIIHVVVGSNVLPEKWDFFLTKNGTFLDQFLECSNFVSFGSQKLRFFQRSDLILKRSFPGDFS